ncbi:MAG TPA: hypothetical protein VG098_04770 [Nitrososphaera sp.]|nr:hypothetical protein [Nitrososphaera sp.]
MNSNNSNNNNDTRLELSSVSDFPHKKVRAGLVRLLRIIREDGKDGISTRKLCEEAFKTRNYGMRIINKAYDEGYIKRYGKGNYPQEGRIQQW